MRRCGFGDGNESRLDPTHLQVACHFSPTRHRRHREGGDRTRINFRARAGRRSSCGGSASRRSGGANRLRRRHNHMKRISRPSRRPSSHRVRDSASRQPNGWKKAVPSGGPNRKGASSQAARGPPIAVHELEQFRARQVEEPAAKARHLAQIPGEHRNLLDRQVDDETFRDDQGVGSLRPEPMRRAPSGSSHRSGRRRRPRNDSRAPPTAGRPACDPGCPANPHRPSAARAGAAGAGRASSPAAMLTIRSTGPAETVRRMISSKTAVRTTTDEALAWFRPISRAISSPRGPARRRAYGSRNTASRRSVSMAR